MVKSKETVRNSWPVLTVSFGSQIYIITIIKGDPYLPITAKIRNKR